MIPAGSYPAIITKQRGTDYGIHFPDLPGCVTAGKTYSEAVSAAREALALHIAMLEAYAAPIPQPSVVAAPSPPPGGSASVVQIPYVRIPV